MMFDQTDFDRFRDYAEGYIRASEFLAVGVANHYKNDFYFTLAFMQTLGLASELTLKAALMRAGVIKTDRDLRSYGHDLMKAHKALSNCEGFDQVTTEIASDAIRNNLRINEKARDYLTDAQRPIEQYYSFGMQLNHLHANYYESPENGDDERFRTRYPNKNQRYHGHWSPDIILLGLNRIQNFLTDANDRTCHH